MEDHPINPRTRKWERIRVVGLLLQMTFLWLINGGDPNLPSGMIDPYLETSWFSMDINFQGARFLGEWFNLSAIHGSYMGLRFSSISKWDLHPATT